MTAINSVDLATYHTVTAAQMAQLRARGQALYSIQRVASQ